ncbi:sensor histidine kinase [Flagellimonas sediminis]|nr:histidine kinase [Allomuricauda sediminis]
MFTPSKNDHQTLQFNSKSIIQIVLERFKRQKDNFILELIRKKLLILILFLLSNTSFQLFAQIDTLDRQTKELPYSYYISEDPEIDFENIIKGHYIFKTNDDWRIDDIYATYWIRIDFINELDTLETQKEWCLRPTTFSLATLYFQNLDSIEQKPIGTYNKPKPNNSLLYAQGIPFKKDQLINGRYLYIKGVRFVSIPKRVRFRYLSNYSNRFYTDYYTNSDIKKFLPDHVYFGACLIIISTFMLIFLNAKRLEFLYYSLFVFFSMIYLTRRLNLEFYMTLRESLIGLWFLAISQILINLMYLNFAINYLNTKLQYPKLHKFIQLTIIILVALIFLDTWVYFNGMYQMHDTLQNFQRILMTVFGLSSMIYLIFKTKDRLVIFIVLGSFIFLAGALGFLFTNDRHYMMTGSLIEFIIFSLGLAYKIKLQYEAKLTLQEEVSLKEISALRAQMNPHFIFNSLSSIQNLILKNDRPAALKYLTQFGKLARNVLESSNEAVVTLSEEIALLKSYLELESLRFDNAFEYTIELDENLDAGSLEIPLMLIQPFAENAIIHGLVGKKEGLKKLMFRFKKEGPFTIIEIEDNGVGRVVSRIHAEASKKQRKSRGMEITEKRLKMFNQNKVNQNKVEIVDKYDAYGNATGTKVIIQIFNP